MTSAFIRFAVSLALLAGIIVYFVVPVMQGFDDIGSILSQAKPIRGPHVP